MTTCIAIDNSVRKGLRHSRGAAEQPDHARALVQRPRTQSLANLESATVLTIITTSRTVAVAL
jgi:hypothetical protein